MSTVREFETLSKREQALIERDFKRAEERLEANGKKLNEDSFAQRLFNQNRANIEYYSNHVLNVLLDETLTLDERAEQFKRLTIAYTATIYYETMELVEDKLL